MITIPEHVLNSGNNQHPFKSHLALKKLMYHFNPQLKL